VEIVNIYTDASIKNKKIKAGIYITLPGVTLSSSKEYSENLYNCFSNVVMAEMIGIDSALQFCLKEKYIKLFLSKKIIIHNDNTSAINNMSSTTEKIGKKHIEKIKNDLNSIIIFKWIPRTENKKADKLTKKYYKYYNISTKIILWYYG